MNSYETYDSFIPFPVPSLEGTFFNFESHREINFPRLKYPLQARNSIFIYSFTLSEVKIEHTREIYNLLDVIGDLGGVIDIVILLIGFFVFPYSEHNFYLKAIQKMFLARTKNNSIFIQSRKSQLKQKIPLTYLGTIIQKEASRHKYIRISNLTNFKLYCHSFLSCFFSK